MKAITSILVALLVHTTVWAQDTTYRPGQVFTVGPTVPPTCTIGGIFIRNLGVPGIYVCTATNVWTPLYSSVIPPPSSGGVPQGSILLVDVGACPLTYTEVLTLAGRTLVGTLAASMNVGTVGGADSITPSGTVVWPAGVPTNGAIGLGSFVNTATATTGNCAATNIAAGTGSTTACKATAPNLTVPAEGHSGSLTSPVITWPAGVPAFSGASFDNRSAFARVIFCKKD